MTGTPEQIKLGLDRLTKLAEHLESGELYHDKFDFNQWHCDASSSNGCGSCGCAIGECPGLFPEDWCFSRRVNGIEFRNGEFGRLKPRLRKFEYLNSDTLADAEKFFSLSLSESRHLFAPFAQNCVLFGGSPLNNMSTRYDVAKNLRIFINQMQMISPIPNPQTRDLAYY